MSIVNTVQLIQHLTFPPKPIYLQCTILFPMKKSIPFFLFYFLLIEFPFHQIAGQTLVDSIENILRHVKKDTITIHRLNSLCWDINNINPEKGLKYSRQVLALAEEAGFKSGIAYSLNNIGNIYEYRGSYDKAMEYYIRSLRIREELHDEDGLANCYTNLGILYGNLNKNKESLSYLLKAIALDEKLHDTVGVATNLNNIGIIYKKMGDENKALEYYMKAMNMNEKTGNYSGIASNHTNIGSMFSEMKEYERALEHFQKALDYELKKGDKWDMTIDQYNIAEVYYKMGKYDLAIAAADRAIEYANEIGAKDDLKNCYKLLSNSWFNKGNHQKAYQYFQLYSDLKDSIFNEQSHKQIVELQTKYDTEKNEKEIKILVAEKQLQKVLIYSISAGFFLVLVMMFFAYRAYSVKKKANHELAVAYDVIAQKNKNITASIEYARTLQDAVLPPKENFDAVWPENFIVFCPKDIVSGDFYWLYEISGSKQQQAVKDKPPSDSLLPTAVPKESGVLRTADCKFVFIALADCTGHGVPGALVSMMGNDQLNQVVIENKIHEPGKVLSVLNRVIRLAFHGTAETAKANDGMDIALLSITSPIYSASRKEVQGISALFAGARRPLLIIREGNVIEYKGDSFSIGGRKDNHFTFTTHKAELFPGDMLYLFSDGYADQFGGPNDKKFKYSALKELLQSIAALTVQEQKAILFEKHWEWKGDKLQTDDITVIGIRI